MSKDHVSGGTYFRTKMPEGKWRPLRPDWVPEAEPSAIIDEALATCVDGNESLFNLSTTPEAEPNASVDEAPATYVVRRVHEGYAAGDKITMVSGADKSAQGRPFGPPPDEHRATPLHWIATPNGEEVWFWRNEWFRYNLEISGHPTWTRMLERVSDRPGDGNDPYLPGYWYRGPVIPGERYVMAAELNRLGAMLNKLTDDNVTLGAMNEQLRDENARLVPDAMRAHACNEELVSEHLKLRSEITALRVLAQKTADRECAYLREIGELKRRLAMPEEPGSQPSGSVPPKSNPFRDFDIDTRRIGR